MGEVNKIDEKKNFIDRYAKILVVLAVMCGAASGSLGALVSAPATVIGFWRLLIAVPFFAVPVLTKAESRAKLKRIEKKELALCFLSGAFLFCHYYTWFTSVKMTNVASAAVLASFHPLVVMFITIFIYKKRVSWKAIAAILVALGGGVMIMCSDISLIFGGRLSGNLFAFAAGICMGVYFAIGGKVRQTVDGSIYVMLVFASCAICFAIANAVSGTPVLGYPIMDYVYIICMVFICQLGSHAVFNLCMGHVSSLYVSTWEAGDPVFSTLIALVLLRQVPSLTEVIGCAVVVTALLLYNKFEQEAEQTHV